MRDSGSSYEISLDPARVDRDVLWDFLATAYWGRWRTRADVEGQLESAWRVVSVHERATGAMVGFARAISDGASIAYLADVFVLPEHRGRGLGDRIVAAMVDDEAGRVMRWMLHTKDAHGLYHRFGFAEPSQDYLERTSRRP